MQTCLSENKLLFTFFLLTLSGCMPADSPEIIQTYPLNETYFTQGLTVYNETAILQSNGLYGESAIRIIDLETGKVLKEKRLAQTVFGEGNTYINNTIILLTWKKGEAYYLDENFTRLQTKKYAGEGWGLTHNNTHLIMSNGSSTLQLRDPKTFNLQKTFKVTQNNQSIQNLNELAYRNGKIYANVWLTDKIIEIELETGHVTNTYTFPKENLLTTTEQQKANVLNGIMNRQGTLYITGKKYPYIYKTKI